MIIDLDFYTKLIYMDGSRVAVPLLAFRLAALLALSSPTAWSKSETADALSLPDPTEALDALRAAVPALAEQLSAWPLRLTLRSPILQIQTPLTHLEDLAQRVKDPAESITERRNLFVVLYDAAERVLPAGTGEFWIEDARARAREICREGLFAAWGVDIDEAPELLDQLISAGRQNFLGLSASDRPSQTLVGRDEALAQLAAQLPDAQLLTLVGPGGVGKTALGQALLDRLPAPLTGLKLFWADFRHVSGHDQLLDRLLQLAGIGTPMSFLAPGTDTLALALGGFRKGLVFLDNIEGLDADALGLVSALAARTRILATSRRQLDIPGERFFLVAPLALPDHQDADGKTLKALAQEFPSVALYVERLQARKGRMVPSALDAVRAIDRTSGLPSQIDLAAQFSGAGDVQTIDEAIEALGADERDLLARLSPFLAPVAAQEGQERLLERLADAGLALSSGTGLFRLPVPVRDKAGALLAARPDAYRLRENYIERIEALGALGGDELVRHLPDVRQAAQLLVQRERFARAVRLAVSCVPAACGAGRLVLMENILREVGRAPLSEQLAAGVTDGLGRVLLAAGKPAEALRELEIALPTWKRCGPPRNVARAASNIGICFTQLGRYDQAQTAFAEALAGFRALGEVVAVGSVLANIGAVALEQENGKVALASFQEAVRITRYQDPHWCVAHLLGVAESHVLLGNLKQARVAVQESLGMSDAAQHGSQRARGLLLWSLCDPENPLVGRFVAVAYAWHQDGGVRLSLSAGLSERLSKPDIETDLEDLEHEIEVLIQQVLTISK